MDSAYFLEPNCFLSGLHGAHQAGHSAIADDLTGTLTSFVIDPNDPLNSCSTPDDHAGYTTPEDAGYTSGVDLFSVDCSVGGGGANDPAGPPTDPNDSADDAYCFGQFTLDTSPSALVHDHNNSHSFINCSRLSSNQTDLHHSNHLLEDHSTSNSHQNININNRQQQQQQQNPHNHNHNHHHHHHIFNSNDFNFSCDDAGICGSSSSSSGYSENFDYISDKSASDLGNDSFLYNNNHNDAYNMANNCLDISININTLSNRDEQTFSDLASGDPAQKRSVLMNLLIDGSDIGAGYKLSFH